jgi:hypothetical protein
MNIELTKKILSQPNTHMLVAIKDPEKAKAFHNELATPFDHGFLHQSMVSPGKVTFANGSSVRVVHNDSKEEEFQVDNKFTVVAFDENPDSYVGVPRLVTGIAQMTGCASIIPASALPPDAKVT